MSWRSGVVLSLYPIYLAYNSCLFFSILLCFTIIFALLVLVTVQGGLLGFNFTWFSHILFLLTHLANWGLCVVCHINIEVLIALLLYY